MTEWELHEARDRAFRAWQDSLHPEATTIFKKATERMRAEATANASEELTHHALYDRYRESVLQIEFLDAIGDPHCGTAFYVGEGICVTARHVAEGARIQSPELIG